MKTEMFERNIDAQWTATNFKEWKVTVESIANGTQEVWIDVNDRTNHDL